MCAYMYYGGGQSSRGAYPDPTHPRNIAHICINNHTFRRGIDRVYVELVKYDKGYKTKKMSVSRNKIFIVLQK